MGEEQLPPENTAVWSPTGEPLPFDIHGKTLQELKELGFKEVLSMNMEKDPVTKTLRPKLSAEER